METKTYYLSVGLVALVVWMTSNIFLAGIFLALAVAARHLWISYEVVILKTDTAVHIEWTENGERERFTINI